MELKVRKPQLFLKPIASCDVLEDTEESVLREAHFAPGFGPPGGKATERITHFKPLSNSTGAGLETFTMQGSKGRVLNIISQGPSGRDDDLWMTFTFEWDHPEIEVGSQEEIAKQKEYQKNSPQAIEGVLKVIREMIAKGEL